MPMYALWGAVADTGKDTCLVFCAKDEESARSRASREGVFVSRMLILDKTKTRMSKWSYSDAARALLDAGEAAAALSVLEEHSLLPETGTFIGCRFAVPFLVAGGQTDRAWGMIQQAKIGGYSGVMYSELVEMIELARMEHSVLQTDGRKKEALAREWLIALSEPFCRENANADFDSYEMQLTVRMADLSELTPGQLDLARSVFVEYLQRGPVAAFTRSFDVCNLMEGA